MYNLKFQIWSFRLLSTLNKIGEHCVVATAIHGSTNAGASETYNAINRIENRFNQLTDLPERIVATATTLWTRAVPLNNLPA